MKYPKKYKKEKVFLHFPVKHKDKWVAFKLLKDGTLDKTVDLSYDKECQCWRPCLAHNNRVGYSEKETKKIIKKLYNVKEEKRKKEKGKKKRKNKK